MTKTEEKFPLSLTLVFAVKMLILIAGIVVSSVFLYNSIAPDYGHTNGILAVAGTFILSGVVFAVINYYRRFED